jgi:hypothetical protein
MKEPFSIIFFRRKEAMPLDSAGFFSMITYSWLTRYMKLAYQQGLKQEDIPLCCHKDHCEDAVQRLVDYNLLIL